MTRKYNKTRLQKNKLKRTKNTRKRTKNTRKRTKNTQKGGLFSWQKRCFSKDDCSEEQTCRYRSGFLNISYGLGYPGYHCVSKKSWF